MEGKIHLYFNQQEMIHSNMSKYVYLVTGFLKHFEINGKSISLSFL